MATSDAPDHDKIRKDLVRTVIKEPLCTDIEKAENATREFAVIIEINDDYYKGKGEAAKWLGDLIAKASQTVNAPVVSAVSSIGSERNPYYKARMTPAVIK